MQNPTLQREDCPHFFTIVARNYLAYAIVLGESVLQKHADATFSVFIVDDIEQQCRTLLEERGFQVIYPEQIGLAAYRKFVFQYTVTEASTGVKPFVIQFLFDSGADKVIYLDPDIFCFRRFDEVFAALERFTIVVTPHICSPIPVDHSPGEVGIMSSGVFNLGFIALRKNESSVRFLKWWSMHLRYECLVEMESGHFVDQKWVDLVPACFENVFIMRNASYNIAYWNLHERSLQEREGTLFEVHSGIPVAFIHFSGIKIDDLHSIAKYAARNPFSNELHKKRYTLTDRPDLIPSFERYKELLLREGIEVWAPVPYGYGAYENGETISQLERSLYLTSQAWQESDIDPFAVGSGSFWDACRKSGIKASGAASTPFSATAATRRYSTGMWMVERFLGLLVRAFGPERYLQFAKYMRHQLLPSHHGFLLRRPPPDLPKTAPSAMLVPTSFRGSENGSAPIARSVNR